MTELVREKRLVEVVRTALAANFFSIPRRVRLAVGRAVLEALGIGWIQEVEPGRFCGFAAGTNCNHPAWKGVARGLTCDEKWCPLTKGATLIRAKEEKP